MNNEQNKDNKTNKEKISEYDSEEDTVANNDKNYHHNNPLMEKNLEDCYLEINENNRESYSQILEKCTLTNFEKFIKKYNLS